MFELGPIIRALIHNKGRFWLITLEIALTLAIVVNCATLMLGKYREISRPTGMDEENILVVNSDADPSGAGEMGIPTLAPALCNAIHAACGVRLRRLPIGEQLVQAMRRRG